MRCRIQPMGWLVEASSGLTRHNSTKRSTYVPTIPRPLLVFWAHHATASVQLHLVSPCDALHKVDQACRQPLLPEYLGDVDKSGKTRYDTIRMRVKSCCTRNRLLQGRTHGRQAVEDGRSIPAPSNLSNDK